MKTENLIYWSSDDRSVYKEPINYGNNYDANTKWRSLGIIFVSSTWCECDCSSEISCVTDLRRWTNEIDIRVLIFLWRILQLYFQKISWTWKTIVDKHPRLSNLCACSKGKCSVRIKSLVKKHDDLLLCRAASHSRSFREAPKRSQRFSFVLNKSKFCYLYESRFWPKNLFKMMLIQLIF